MLLLSAEMIRETRDEWERDWSMVCVAPRDFTSGKLCGEAVVTMIEKPESLASWRAAFVVRTHHSTLESDHCELTVLPIRS